MKPQTDPRLSGCLWHANLTALIPLALLAVSLPAALSAQQTVPQNPQDAPSQYPQTTKPKPPAGHYAAPPQPEDAQQPEQASHPAPAPDQTPHPRHVQQHHLAPMLDQTPDPSYARQPDPDPAPDRPLHADHAQQLHLAPAPEQAQNPRYASQPYIALNQAPDPGFTQNPGYAQQPYYAPQAPQQPPDPGYAQGPGYTQNPGYAPNYAQPGYAPEPQGPPQQAMGPDQLEQLVAPIALYPDTLVAQVLAAATYPAQVVGADHWLQAQGYASPDQIAYSAGAQPWDPSVKALTAFPDVLALMDRDLQWTTDLGNAYYNQPQDVLQTIQVLRQRAQGAGTLQSTPQETVSDNQGYIQLAPQNPQVVYVPAYNPWDVYGQPIQPYSGFSLLGSLASFAGSAALRFGPGIAMGAFNATPFGWATWALNWLTQSVLFHQSNYVSQSTSVAHWGNQRNSFQHQPPSPQNGFNRTPGNGSRPGEGYDRYNRPSPQQSFDGQPNRTPQPYSAYRSPEENRFLGQQDRGYQQQNNYARPAPPTYAYNRPQPQAAMPARPQTYGRPDAGYGSNFYGNRSPAYPTRPATEFPRQQQSFRAPAPQYNNFAQRSYSQPYSDGRSYSGGRNSEEPKPEHSEGFHMFGGGHNGESAHTAYRAPKEYKAPKAPKGYGGGGGHHSGGGHSGGGHHGGGHRL